MEDKIVFAAIISQVIGVIGALIIIWGVILCLIRFIPLELRCLRGRACLPQRESLRHQLGSYLLLGLEFLIAADIIRTVFDPSLQELLLLGSIVAIRTVISFFLEREIRAWDRSE